MSNNNRSAAIVKLVIWSVVALILIAIFAIMLFIGTDGIISFESGFQISSRIYYSDEDTYSVGNVSYGDEIKSIDVDWSTGKIDILVWDGDEVKLEEDGDDDLEQYKMRSRVEGDTLQIKFAKSGLRWDADNIEKSLVIYIPKDLALTLHEIDISAATAEVTVGAEEDASEVIVCDRIQLESASGDLKLMGVKADEVSVSAASASLSFNGKADEISVEGVSGALSICGDVEEISVEAVSATVTLKLDRTPSEINVETVSGNVDISLPDDGDGFVAELNGISGSLEYNSKSVGRYHTVGRGIGDFDFETVSGKVSITTRSE